MNTHRFPGGAKRAPRFGRVGLLALAAALVAGALLTGLALAAGSPAVLERWVLASGGASPAAAGQVLLNGTFGQPLVSLSAAGPTTLSAGFWGGGPGSYPIYLPAVQK